MGKKYSFQHMVLEQLDIHMQKMLDLFLTPYTQKLTQNESQTEM